MRAPGHKAPVPLKRNIRKRMRHCFPCFLVLKRREQRYPTFTLPRKPVSAARTQQSHPRMAGPSGHLHTSPRLYLSGVCFLRFTDKVLYPLLLRKFPQRNVSIKLEKLHCFLHYSSPTKDGLCFSKTVKLILHKHIFFF